MRRLFAIPLILALLPALFEARAAGQAVKAGGVARDFTVVERGSGRPLRLGDFAGRIIVLDFFAFWCEPCALASADLESAVRLHYSGSGGNPAHLPVVVIGISIDPGNPERTAEFVRRAGMALTADDPQQAAFMQFDVMNSVPLIVVINGVAGIPGQRQWEVLYSRAGYEGATALRRVIDSVGQTR
jgi:thiol-disulfide isomerase/thioredoxin